MKRENIYMTYTLGSKKILQKPLYILQIQKQSISVSETNIPTGFSSISEASVSELMTTREEMFQSYHIHSNVLNMFIY